MNGRLRTIGCLALALALIAIVSIRARAQSPLDRSRDRGSGIPTSMFGTYVTKGELLIYPFFEYYRDADMEYKPAELGHDLDADFRGKFRASEGLIFASYGFTDRLTAEIEASVITARLDKSPADTSSMPLRLQQSGLGDVEGQIRWRWANENERRPEIFSYFETVLPLQKQKLLIGTPDWEFSLGAGIIRGFPWGTTMLRAALEYSREDGTVDVGEFAVEYLKRLNDRLRVLVAVEGGAYDEVDFITEAQVFLRPNLFLKLNNAFGMTSKATDWAPEVGLMFSFR
jgi:hypothetical protein